MNDEMKKYLEDRTREAQVDPRTAHQVITEALTEPDEDLAWNAVIMLHFRGTKEVFDAASQLCISECPRERTLGANILAQLGIPIRSFPLESVALLQNLLPIENDDSVLDAICIGLGHIHDPTVIPALVQLKTHTSGKVRYAVVFGLLGFENDLAIRTLIELSQDQDANVRDWATFGLGSQIVADTPEIREALFARLSDSDEMTRGEALVGLAKRKDRRIIEPLIEELAGFLCAEYGEYSLQAAEEIADARLLPTLLRLKHSTNPQDETFDEAIRRCSQSVTDEPDVALL